MVGGTLFESGAFVVTVLKMMGPTIVRKESGFLDSVDQGAASSAQLGA